MNSTNNQPDRPGDQSAQGSDDRARRIIAEVATAGRIPGISVAVAGPDGILYSGAQGYADLATRRLSTVQDQYLWFSMTKIATATAAMRLHADGVLDVEAPIGTYLPGYRPHAKHGHPTTRQLLTHTAGLANPLPIRWVRAENQPEDPALLERIVAKHGTPTRAVGTRAAYSNIGYLLAARVIEAVTGQPVQDCVRDTVLTPLAMNGTDYAYRAGLPRSVGYVRIPRVVVPALRWMLPPGIVGPRVDGHTSLRPFVVSGAGYGGLLGTVTDAAKLAAAHAAGPSYAGLGLTSADTEQMRTITSTGKPFDHGIGWFRKPIDAQRTPAFVEHYGTGAGFWNAMRIYPDTGIAMVAMTNTTTAWNFDGLFTELYTCFY
ncbi:CubicO group peptidase (beta-lactamase class C family) [Kribbella steppae]|uniref:CubicO group peptidase (Beta-lactamase class C family) n=1 Tax=Kribbella steppae TaxID=2512223 RepID=A0A4R2H0T9_9ACTN|nr:serine hydrolase domain-containing protein [Kribbella steppae]TCO18100.1 CubicO group peptidase (beta-lactamase class C family) [Kribbella steppae]